MTASLTCRRITSFKGGSVYAWETAEGVTGNILIDPEGSIARPCTPEGTPLGDMTLNKSIGNLDNPAPDTHFRRTFLITASAIFQEEGRQGQLPDEITRTYW